MILTLEIELKDEGKDKGTKNMSRRPRGGVAV